MLGSQNHDIDKLAAHPGSLLPRTKRLYFFPCSRTPYAPPSSTQPSGQDSCLPRSPELSLGFWCAEVHMGQDEASSPFSGSPSICGFVHKWCAAFVFVFR